MKIYSIETSATAEESMVRIYDFIAQHPDSLDTAQRILEMIVTEIRTLSTFPERNQVFGIRRIQKVGNYSIVYQINGDTVEILRVLPSSSQYISKLRDKETK